MLQSIFTRRRRTHEAEILEAKCDCDNPSGTVVSSVAYEPFGPDSGYRTGAAGQETRSFDQDYRLTNVTDLGTVRRGVTRVFENLSYAYYPTNNVETITDAVTSGNDQSFNYDALQRLSTATGSYGSYAYTYDNDGNRLTQALGGVTTSYGYGTGNDLLQTTSMSGITTQTFGYTADGRMATLNPGIESPDGQYITSLSYNQDAQLAAVNAGGSALASYTYDGFGQRLLKTISSTDGNIYQYGQNGMLLEETDQSGAAQADYIYLNGRPIADLAPSSGTLYYLHDDLLGTPQVASDSSQNIQWQASYQPFGETSSVSGTITQNLRLPGQYFDSESGWSHNGFRNYLPDLGRYVEPDPLALQGSGIYYDASTGQLFRHSSILSNANAYSYVGSNPINLIDPLGLSTCKDKTKDCLQKALEALFPGASVNIGDATQEVGGHWNFDVQLTFPSYDAANAFYSSYATSAENGWAPPARFGSGPSVHLENLGDWTVDDEDYSINGTAHIDLYNPNPSSQGGGGAAGLAGHIGIDGLIGHLVQAFGSNIDPLNCTW